MAKAFGAIISAIFFVWFFYGGGLEKQASSEMTKITHQVAADMHAQYQIAARNGSPIDVCVQAGLVSAALLQAKDEEKYRDWKRVEERDCARAGVPR